MAVFNEFHPDSLTINVGEIVRWTVSDTAELHDVTFTDDPTHTSWSPRQMRRGDVFELRFTQPGLFHYLCTRHPLTMFGTVTVAP
jgi:plastocyanin